MRRTCAFAPGWHRWTSSASSGHTLHAVSFSIVALAYYPWLAPLLVPFSAGVALSRVVLGLHYPSDVLAATVIGVLLASLSLWGCRWCWAKRQPWRGAAD